MAESTPVTLLTGASGAGKTTLLNRLLRHPALARTAVLVNPSGRPAINHTLVETIRDTPFPLNGGCACCAQSGGLMGALRVLLPRARRDEVSHIVIETSGQADLAPILTALTHDPVASAAYHLARIVTVVDAVNGVRHLDAHGAVRRQAAVADCLVLTKSDLADPSPLHEVLRRINPGAPLLDGRVAALDPAVLLGGETKSGALHSLMRNAQESRRQP